MSGWQFLTSAVISLVVTAGTYVAMQQYVGPSLGGPLIDVPQLVGLLPEQARGLTEPVGLALVIDGQKEPDSDRVATDTVFEQRPLHGSRLRRGAEVHATLALAVSKVAVPVLAGQLLPAAQKALSDAGLKPGAVTEIVNPQVAPGSVIGSDPPAGTQLRRGEVVSLQVSKGTETVAVPSLRGRSQGSARAALEALGLVLGDVRRGSDDNAADGAVLRQDPAPGTPLAKGQKVSITVND
jgi:eukaryotic-like serine/threonine-protein kinase